MCGTDRAACLRPLRGIVARGFSGRPGDHTTTRASTAPPVSPANCLAAQDPDLPGPRPPNQHRPLSIRGGGASCRVPPSLTTRARVQDSLTCSPSPTPPDNQRPRLRIRLTLGRLPLPRNPQASGVAGSSPPFALLIPAFSLVGAPSGPSGPPSPLPTTLPYHGRLASLASRRTTIRGFGRLLEPRYIVGAGALDQ